VSGFVEKPDAAAVVPLDAGWCDVGSCAALWEISTKDDKGNAQENPGTRIHFLPSYGTNSVASCWKKML
jgi:mannose-1-phosphate guanylyltransferase